MLQRVVTHADKASLGFFPPSAVTGEEVMMTGACGRDSDRVDNAQPPDEAARETVVVILPGQVRSVCMCMLQDSSPLVIAGQPSKLVLGN